MSKVSRRKSLGYLEPRGGEWQHCISFQGGHCILDFFSAFLWGISPCKTANVGYNRITGYIHVYPMSACNIHYKTQELKRAELAISCMLFNYFFKDVTFLEVPCRSRMLTAITAFGMTAIL